MMLYLHGLTGFHASSMTKQFLKIYINTKINQAFIIVKPKDKLPLATRLMSTVGLGAISFHAGFSGPTGGGGRGAG